VIDIVKDLFENNVISEEIKSEIETAWESKIQENREQVATELREEFATKYEHDKSTMVEAIESMLSERLQGELEEFNADREGLIEARARYAQKMKQDTQAMEAFVLQNLKGEIAELHEDRNSVANNIQKLEEFIVEALAKEIAEFYEDKQDLAETKVKLVKENKAKFDEVKNKFIKTASSMVSETVSKTLKGEINQLKEDIESARQNDFGRRIFEAFATEYNTSYLNEKSETAKLLKVVNQKTQELEEAAKVVAETRDLLESKDHEIKSINDSIERSNVMNELLAPLNSEKREVMKDLLESVQTDKLRKQFDKYMPSVMDGGKPAKQALTEAKEITGDKKTKAQSTGSEVNTAEVFDIRRLAGLKV